jgi:hypothetical protein
MKSVTGEKRNTCKIPILKSERRAILKNSVGGVNTECIRLRIGGPACERGTEPSGSIEGREIVGWLSSC